MRLKNGENHLTQWDRHRVLVFTEYPPGTELHMWCDFFDGNALKFYTDDNREVVVPDVMLQVSGSLRVCVFVTKYGVSYTQVRYIVPVEARPRPDDYVTTVKDNTELEEMYAEYTELFHGNGYVKTLMTRVRKEVKIIGG